MAIYETYKSLSGNILKVGDVVTICGASYDVYEGQWPKASPSVYGLNHDILLNSTPFRQLNVDVRKVDRIYGYASNWLNFNGFPEANSLQSLTRLVIYLMLKSEELGKSTPVTLEPKPKRAPRLKNGIPESTYRWRERTQKLALADLKIQRINKALGLPADANADTETVAASIVGDYLNKCAKVENLKGALGAVNLALDLPREATETDMVAKHLMASTKTLETLRDSLERDNAELKSTVDTVKANNQILRDRNDQLTLHRNSLHSRVEALEATLKGLAGDVVEGMEAVAIARETRNENAQARRDAWSATYKLEQHLSEPSLWTRLVNRLRGIAS